jgi:O-antigen ligase
MEDQLSDQGQSTDKRVSFLPFLPFPFIAVLIAVLLSVALVIVDIRIGANHLPLGFFLLGTLIMATVITLRQDDLAGAIVIATSLCLDWYLGTYVIALGMSVALLILFFLFRSPRHPWLKPRPFGLWILFLLLTIVPAITPIMQGNTSAYDTVYYYPDIVLASFLMYWLGNVIARDMDSVRRFLQLIAAFGTFVAVHIILEEITGNLLFATANVQLFLLSKSNYQLTAGSGIARLGSFFVQPDATSAFLAMLLFVPLGLFVESSSFWKKTLFLMEVLLMVIALLFTYGAAAWMCASLGLVVFVLLVGSLRYKLQMGFCVLIAVAILLLGFSSQIGLLVNHAMAANELTLREGLWETAVRVIQAFPVTGVGLSRAGYFTISDQYRVVAEYTLENNPHNAYLEWGAMAGLPVLLVFLALLAFALGQALRNWYRLDRRTRALFGGGIAALFTFCINNLSFGLWTLPPMAVLGWMLLGVMASPLPFTEMYQRMKQKQAPQSGRLEEGTTCV